MKKITEDGEIVDVVTEEPAGFIPNFKTPYNHDRDQAARETALTCLDPSKTQQQFANDADINAILRKFTETGQLPTQTGSPVYQDIDKEFDLQDQMVTGAEVEEAWNALPAAVRNILGDPQKFVAYVDHCLETGDLSPLQELGLAKAEASEPAQVSTGTPAAGTPAEPVQGSTTPPSGA